MNVAELADLLHEASIHHGDFEAVAPPHDWWDWYAAYMDARQCGTAPAEAAAAAGRYMAEVKEIIVSPACPAAARSRELGGQCRAGPPAHALPERERHRDGHGAAERADAQGGARSEQLADHADERAADRRRAHERDDVERDDPAAHRRVGAHLQRGV